MFLLESHVLVIHTYTTSNIPSKVKIKKSCCIFFGNTNAFGKNHLPIEVGTKSGKENYVLLAAVSSVIYNLLKSDTSIEPTWDFYK